MNSISLEKTDGQYGANIVRNITPASSESIQVVTNGWKKINVVALSEENGTLGIKFRLNEGSGEVLFDQIKIKRIENDTDFKLYTYTNSKGKTGRIVFGMDNVSGTSITESEIQNWLGVLLDVREYMINFTGTELDNGNVDIIATNYYTAVAYVIRGCTEIQWMKNCVDLEELHRNFQNGANTPFWITHEIGHQHIMSTPFCFDTEYWGTTLGLIII